jgi:uncharacterized protein
MRGGWLAGLGGGIPAHTIAATFLLGAVGGGLGHLAGVPLGMLLGSMLSVAACAALGLTLWGRAPAVPQGWRFVLVPVIGVGIGATVPPDVLDQAGRWWVTLLGLALFVPVAHGMAFGLYRLIGGLDRPTAYFAGMPGGFIEALAEGERHGAEVQMLLMLQFLRLILCIVMLPIIFALVTGREVGTGAVGLPGQDAPLMLSDIAWLGLAAAVGWWGAHALRLPAPVLSGPLLLSAAIHVAGLTEAAPPGWMILGAQWVVGTSLGARFAGFRRRQLWLAMRLAVVNIVAAMGLAVALALVLAGPAGQPVAAVILAFAPGGIAEMSLVALSLNLSAVYVTLHHLMRIVLAVVLARMGMGLAGIAPR